MARRTISAKGPTGQTSEQQFLSWARRCRTEDLKQLQVLCALAREIAELVHALQKERGATSIFLASSGEQFAARLAERVDDSERLAQNVRTRLECLDDRIDLLRCGARFSMRLALALRALDTLSLVRSHIASMALVPQDSVRTFTGIIGSLLAVSFDIADAASDPEVSRALVALVNFSQGKEYAGQERATAGAAISRGHFIGDEPRRWQQLIAAQEQAFRIFADFATLSQNRWLEQLSTSAESAELTRIRETTLLSGRTGKLDGITAGAWYEKTTRRIDAMKGIEEGLAGALSELCARKLQEDETSALSTLDGPGAVLVAAVDPTLSGAGVASGIGLYGLGGLQPKPMRSILAVLQAQSRRIEEVNQQLESARGALFERKTIERAKGLLMRSRGLSEQEAYSQMRETAMNQNKRLVEIAEAVVSMAPMPER